ncbi:MAG: hypothetical protein CBD16_05700 [Betaproteobacteria bacterium TMED156]|nr:MAG: hypothetical protein CBD16_05700 [Betaproteobacteria bacterium TMED156]
MNTEKNTSLIDKIIKNPQSFDLMQSISILERDAVENGSSPVGAKDSRCEAIRFLGKISLSFEASDLTFVKRSKLKSHSYDVQSPIMVLLGTGGAMPEPFTELVMYRNSQKDLATAEFLDIFHNKFLALFYLARKKRFPGLSWESPDKSIIAKASNLLGALGREKIENKKKGEVHWIRHTGLLSGVPRSMAGLISILKDRFRFDVITGDQFIGCWYELNYKDICKLDGSSENCLLGKNIVLGKKIWDQTSGIKISIKNISWEKMQNFLPGGIEFLPMRKIIQRYLSRDIRVEISFKPKKNEIKEFQLFKNSDNFLGFSSWLKPKKTENFQEVKLQFDASHVI